MSESTPFSRQRLPAPTEPLADRVAAVLAECDAARVRERARRDRIAAVEARPVPPAVTPELRAALHASLAALGIAHVGFVFHSFRAGGALYLLNCEVELVEVLRRGRWGLQPCRWRRLPG